MSLITQIFKSKTLNAEKLRRDIHNDLLRREAAVGKTIFGEVPEGSSREFFRLDTHTWVWVENKKGKDGKTESNRTVYTVRNNQVLKSVNGGQYNLISIQEAKNFHKALKEYGKRVSKQVYDEEFVA